MQELRQLWDEHLKSSFPDELKGEEVAGIDLILLDGGVGGYVSSALGCSGKLPQGDIRALRSCLRDLRTVLERLDGVDVSYFKRLERMAELALGKNK